MKSVLYILIYCMLLIGCRAPIELKEDLSFFPQTLASSSACNKDNCLAFATERYEVNETNYTPVDMVFVLDVSRSMEDNLEKISLASSSLISYIEPLDWRIAFTTADHGDSQYYCASGKIKTRISSTGQSQKFCPKEHRIFPQPADRWTNYTGIDPKFGTFMYLQNDKHILNQSILSNQIQNYNDVFKDTITRNSYERQSPCQWPPYCQGDHEQPLRVLKSIIERSSAQASSSFMRNEAVLMVFILTDETERAADPKNATTATDVMNTFKKTFSHYPDKRIIVYGISITNPSCLEQQNTVEANYSEQLSQLIDHTKGAAINICQSSYQSTFAEISKQLQRYVSQIPLKFKPIVTHNTPITVRVFNKDGIIMMVKWEKNPDNGAISFAEILPPGTQVEISYYYDKTS